MSVVRMEYEDDDEIVMPVNVMCPRLDVSSNRGKESEREISILKSFMERDPDVT